MSQPETEDASLIRYLVTREELLSDLLDDDHSSPPHSEFMVNLMNMQTSGRVMGDDGVSARSGAAESIGEPLEAWEEIQFNGGWPWWDCSNDADGAHEEVEDRAVLAVQAHMRQIRDEVKVAHWRDLKRDVTQLRAHVAHVFGHWLGFTEAPVCRSLRELEEAIENLARHVHYPDSIWEDPHGDSSQ